MEESYFDVKEAVDDIFDWSSSFECAADDPVYFKQIDSIYKRKQLIDKVSEIIDKRKSFRCVCRTCMDCLSDMCERKYKEFQRAIRAYGLSSYALKQEPIHCESTHKSIPNSNILESFGQSDMYGADGLLSTIDELTSQLNQYELQIADCNNQLNDIALERIASYHETEKLTKEICDLEAALSSFDDDLQLTLSLVDSGSRELDMLGNRKLITKPLYDVYTDGNMFAINGLRVSYKPASMINLNWAEINAGWSCFASMLSTLRRRAGLPDAIDILRPSDLLNGGGENDVTGVRIQVRPLRKRVVLIKSVFGLERTPVKQHGHGPVAKSSTTQAPFQIKSTIDKAGNAVVETEDCSLMLEGGSDKFFEYRRALVMFAVMVVVTASQLMPQNNNNNVLGPSTLSLLQDVKRGSDRDWWGYEDDDLDDYCDVDVAAVSDHELCAANDTATSGSRIEGTESNGGSKIEKLVHEVLTILLAFVSL